METVTGAGAARGGVTMRQDTVGQLLALSLVISFICRVRFSYLPPQIKSRYARHRMEGYSLAWQGRGKFHNKTDLASKLKAFGRVGVFAFSSLKWG